MDYTEQELLAVKESWGALCDASDPSEFALYLEEIATRIDDGEVLERVASAIRDVGDGVA